MQDQAHTVCGVCFYTSNHGQYNWIFWKEESFFHGILLFLSRKLRIEANSCIQKPTLLS